MRRRARSRSSKAVREELSGLVAALEALGPEAERAVELELSGAPRVRVRPSWYEVLQATRRAQDAIPAAAPGGGQGSKLAVHEQQPPRWWLGHEAVRLFTAAHPGASGAHLRKGVLDVATALLEWCADPKNEELPPPTRWNEKPIRKAMAPHVKAALEEWIAPRANAGGSSSRKRVVARKRQR